MARLRYSVSFYAIIDFLAVFPYYVALSSAYVDQYDDYLRLLRLLRILKVTVYTIIHYNAVGGKCDLGEGGILRTMRREAQPRDTRSIEDYLMTGKADRTDRELVVERKNMTLPYSEPVLILVMFHQPW